MQKRYEPDDEAGATAGTADASEETGGDWRVRYESRITSDVPAAFPGGPAHKAGTRIVAITLGPRRGEVPLAFETPASAALALNIAVRAVSESEPLRAQLKTTRVISPTGPAENISPDTTSALFDFFEHVFVALAFSYQAVEALANEEIERVVTSTVRVQTNRGWRDMDAAECQRRLSTSDKLTHVLARLLSLSPPKNQPWWARFTELERFRNDSIHLKAHRAYPRTEPPEASLFHELLAAEQLSDFPKTAVDVAEYLLDGRELPGWLRAGRELVNALPRGANGGRLR